MNKLRIITYIKLFRPTSVLLMCLFLFFPIFKVTGNVVFSFIQILPFILMLSGTIALNDCCDLEKDRINKPQRPLVNSVVDVKQAFIVACITIVLGVMLGVAAYHQSPPRIGCFLLVTLILSCYNIRHPIIPLLKTVITASMTVLALSFAYTFSEPKYTQYCFLGAAFFFILGRELLMDIRDVDGDKINKYRTVAVIWGIKLVQKLAVASFSVSSAFVVAMAPSCFSWMKLLLTSLLIFIEYYCLFKCIRTNNTNKQNTCILFLWVPIIGVLILQFW